MPKRYVNKVKERLYFAGIKVKTEEWIGFLTLFPTTLGLLSIFLLYFFYGVRNPLSFIGSFVLITLIVFFTINAILVLIKDRRAIFVNKILPDVLMLISSNLRSGMTVEQAILNASRPEFKSFAIELGNASKKTLMGENFVKASESITKHIDSKDLKYVVELINEGQKSGGNLANLLSTVSYDLRAKQRLLQKTNASTITYVIMFFIATILGAPLLFSLSTFLVSTMEGLITVNVPLSFESQVSRTLRIKAPIITENYLNYLSISMILLNALFVSFMLGYIQKGRANNGIKWIPILMPLSVFFFFLFKNIINSVFTGFFF